MKALILFVVLTTLIPLGAQSQTSCSSIFRGLPIQAKVLSDVGAPLRPMLEQVSTENGTAYKTDFTQKSSWFQKLKSWSVTDLFYNEQAVLRSLWMFKINKQSLGRGFAGAVYRGFSSCRLQKFCKQSRPFLEARIRSCDQGW